MIEGYLEEGKEYLRAGDGVQASEKLYKAAEETVKALAQVYADGVWKEVKEKGKWTSPLLFEAVRWIARNMGSDEVRYYWHTAWFLHVEGFHEGRLSLDYIKEQVEDIEKLVKLK